MSNTDPEYQEMMRKQRELESRGFYIYSISIAIITLLTVCLCAYAEYTR